MAKYTSGRQKDLKVGIVSYSENLTSLSVIGNANFTGIVTASSFSGNFVGVASTAIYATTAYNLTDAANINTGTISTNRLSGTYNININGNSNYSTSSGVATYSSNAGVSTYATTSGVSTYATSSGIATYATTSGVSTYATSSGIATYATTSGISTYATTAGISTYATTSGISTYATTSGVATALQNSRTFQITGDIIASPVTFNGTGNVSLAATIQPNSVALGTDTTGDYVQSISGTLNQIGITNGTGESSTPVISFAVNPTIPGNVTIGNDLQVNNNLNVTGNITIGGTSAYVIVNDFRVKDGDIVLGFTTDSNGNDVSNDTTANHGGISVASTVGSPLVNLYIAGIETTPVTYKKIMWFKSGSFSGLNTDAWLSNYAIGIGSTQFPNGTRLAAGAVQFTERDLAAVRNINATGIVSATSFYGSGQNLIDIIATKIDGVVIKDEGISLPNNYGILDFVGNYVTATGVGSTATITFTTPPYSTSAGIATYATTSGVSTYATSSGIATYATTSGVSTYATSSGIATYSTTSGIATYATSSGISTYSTTAGIATYATTAGVSTNIKGGLGGNIPYQSSADTTAFVSNGTSGQVLIFNGSVPTWGNASNAAGAFAGITIRDEGVVVGTDNSITTINFVGNNVTATATSGANGISTVTIADYVSVAGIATYATTAGVSTNIKGGLGGNIPYQSSADTTAFVSNGTSGQVLIFNGSVPTWGNVSAASGSFGGITIRDEGVVVGTASSVTTINFVGNNVTATATSGANGISTVTIADYVSVAGIATYATTAGVSTNVIGGIGSVTQLSVSGVSTLGITSTTNLTTQQLSVSGVSTFASNTTINSSGIVATGIITAINAATQDSISLNGRAGGTGSFNLSLVPTTLGASRTATFQDVSGTVYVTGGTDVSLADGGTNASLTASNGGIVYSTASAMAILSGTATAGQILRSGASAAPSWSTATFPSTATSAGTILRADGTNWVATSATYPTTTTANRILYSSATNTVGEITSANTSALITNSTGVPSFTSGTTANRLLRTDGTTVSFAQANLTTDVTGTLPIANGGTNSTATATNGGVAYGTGTAYAFTSAGTLGQILQSSGAAAPVWTSSLNVSGISTIANLRVTPVGIGATVGSAGIVTYYGDGSQLTGINIPSSSYQFNTGITSILSASLVGLGSIVLTLPSTSGRRYIIHSINASNVAAGNTDVNVIGAIDYNGGERSYFAYNIPILTGTSIELLSQPQILNPSDQIVMRSTDYDRIGIDNAVQVYISYEIKVNTNYFGVGVGSVGLGVTDPVGIYTSSTYPSVLQSIKLSNRTDTGDYPVSVTVTSGITTTYLVDDLIVPKYCSVEILDKPKAITTNDIIKVSVRQAGTIDVQVSGIKVT